MNINTAVKEDRQRYVQLERANDNNLMKFIEHSKNFDNPEELCVAANIMFNLTNISLNTQKNFQSVPQFMTAKHSNPEYNKLVKTAYSFSNECSTSDCIDWFPAINLMESLLTLYAKENDKFAEVNRYFQMIKNDLINLVNIYL